jgi:hypothetical protein
MRRMIPLAITLLISGMVMSCGGGSGGTNSAVVLINKSGSVSPAFMYEETITVENRSMHIRRTGGEQIVVGEWAVTISQNEAADIKDLSNMIDPVEDKDSVSDTAPLGGGFSELHVADFVYYNGSLVDPVTFQQTYHTFSPDVRNLADAINGLVNTYGFNRVPGGGQ